MELHGAYFGVAEGSLFVLDPEAKEFRSVREATVATCCVGWAKRTRVPSITLSSHTVGTLRFAHPTNLAHAAFFFAVISLRLIRHSAIWIAFSAAPLRRLSDTHHSDRPFSTVLSSRMRLI